MIYSFSSKSKKTKEKLLLAGFWTFGAMLMFLSLLPGFPFPFLPQFFAVCLFAAGISLLSKSFLRSFTYEIVRNGQNPDVPDLVVTERAGQRSTVVCRISVGDVQDAFSLPANQQKAFFRLCRGKQTYRYTDEWLPEQLLTLVLKRGSNAEYLFLSFDKELLSFLK